MWVYVPLVVIQAIRIAGVMSIILTKNTKRLFIILNCD
jgi:hypothetical protein